MNALLTTAPLAASTRPVNWDTFIPKTLVPAIFDTLYMVAITMVIAGFLGLLLGALLYTTREGNIYQNRFVYAVLNVLVNIVRPIPFIILIAALGPLTSAVVQTRLGLNAAIFAMSFGASFAIARIVEQNMVSIDPGVVEAARAMGASFIVIGVVDMSAMAWYVGGGGLGKVAIVDGYQKFQDQITWLVVAVIIILVQLVQFIGNTLAKRVLHR